MMKSDRSIVFCPPCSAEPLLGELLRELESGKDVLVLVPTSHAAGEFERRLLEMSDAAALWDRPAATFYALAERVAGDADSPSLPHAAQMFAVKEAVARAAPSYYRGVAHTSGFSGLVRDLIQELKEALVWPDEFAERVIEPLKRGGAPRLELERLSDVEALVREYQGVVADLGGDAEDVILGAIEKLEAGAGGFDLDMLVLFGFSDLSPLQWRFFEAMVGALSPERTIFAFPFSRELVVDGGVSGFDATRKTLGRLAGQGFLESDFSGSRSGFEVLARHILLKDEKFDGSGVDVEMVEFFDEPDEVEGVLGLWRREAQRFGVDRASILHRQSQQFGSLFWNALWRDVEDMSDHWHPMVAANTAPAALVELLGALSKEEPEGVVAALKNGAITEGLGELRGLERDYLWRAADIDFSDFIGRLPMGDGLRRFVMAARAGTRSPREWLGLTCDLVRTALAPRLVEISPSQLSSLNVFMKELGALVEGGFLGSSEVGFDGWHSLVAEAMRFVRATPYSPFFDPVASPFDVRGGTADCVIIGGLNLNTFPMQPRENPLFGDEVRRRLAMHGGPELRTAEQAYREQWPLFYQAVSAARKKLVLTRHTHLKRDVRLLESPFWRGVCLLSGVEPRHPPRAPKRFGGSKFEVQDVVYAGDSARSVVRGWLGVEGAESQAATPAGRLNRASVTSMDSLVRCPYLHIAGSLLCLERREDRTLQVRWRRELGTIMHVAFENIIEFEDVSEEKVLTILEDVVERRREELGISFSDEQRSELSRWAARLASAIRGFRLLQEAVGLEQLGVERELPIFYESGSLKFEFRGRPDSVWKVSDGVVVIDFKTSKRSRIDGGMKNIASGKCDDRTSVQLPLYAQGRYADAELKAVAILGLREPKLSVLATGGFEEFLRERFKGRFEELKDFVSTFRSEKDLLDHLRGFLRTSLDGRLRAMVDGRIERNPLKDSLCKDCLAKDFCRKPLL